MSTGEYTGRSTAVQVGPIDDRPLTEDEQKLVQRLLSDPFAFPIAYKQWLVAFIESSEMTLPMATIAGLNAALGIGVPGGGGLAQLPAGIILPYGGSAPPNGALMCNGAAYSRVTREALFEVIGTKYGAPDGSTFNVPNLIKRVPVGVDSSDVDLNDLGKTGGEKNHTLTIPEIPAHGHVIDVSPLVAFNATPSTGGTGAAGGDRSLVGAAASAQSTGGGGGHNNMQPFVTVNYIITHG